MEDDDDDDCWSLGALSSHWKLTVWRILWTGHTQKQANTEMNKESDPPAHDRDLKGQLGENNPGFYF